MGDPKNKHLSLLSEKSDHVSVQLDTHIYIYKYITQTYWAGNKFSIPRVSTFQKTGLERYVPWSKVAILGMVIPPLIGILIMGI